MPVAEKNFLAFYWNETICHVVEKNMLTDPWSPRRPPSFSDQLCKWKYWEVKAKYSFWRFSDL